ncbi:MAG TPA: pyridoxamine 5'-phosphate oxidase family protein [Afifellaceae bacterium]|nr:pyridoxamine 5'-phosphate oxidase family protein [Afifellaceae bacterium]
MSGDSFSPVAAARALLARCGTGALATLSADGQPFASFVTTAPGEDGAPLLLLSQLAVHTRNLERDARASLLLVEPDETASDPLARSRLTLTGIVGRAADQARARESFLARHGKAAGYAGFADFAFYRLAPAAGHLVAGFGRIAPIDPAAILSDFPPSAG